MIYTILPLLFILSFSRPLLAEKASLELTKSPRSYCLESLQKISVSAKIKDIHKICEDIETLSGCKSTKGLPIYHYEFKSKRQNAKRIFTLALIHGDEFESGNAAKAWMLRLSKINPRNTWRVIPVVNPDGWNLKTRTNANKVDLNRNFPSKDWGQLALKWWKSKKKSDPRRYPGPSAGSETETQCLIKHFKDFKPDFIIAIHTPLGILDFDGPKKIPFPRFSPLPWISLGTYPGSLGRYMWKDQKVPVLTIELKGSKAAQNLEKFDQLQDVSGTVAIQSNRYLKKSKKQKKQKK